MARKIPGEFVPLSVDLAADPAILEAGPDAELLYIRALQYAKRQRTDGLVPKPALPRLTLGLRRPTTLPKRLVDAGLWEVVEGGWRIRSWLRWNLSLEEQEARRERNRVNVQKRWAARKEASDE